MFACEQPDAARSTAVGMKVGILPDGEFVRRAINLVHKMADQACAVDARTVPERRASP